MKVCIDLNKYSLNHVTVRNHNRSTALERSGLKKWVGELKTGITGTQPRPQLQSWLKTYSCSVRVKVF